MQESQPEKIWGKAKRKSPIPLLNRIVLNNQQHEKEKNDLLHDVVTGLPKHDLLEKRLNDLLLELKRPQGKENRRAVSAFCCGYTSGPRQSKAMEYIIWS